MNELVLVLLIAFIGIPMVNKIEEENRRNKP